MKKIFYLLQNNALFDISPYDLQSQVVTIVSKLKAEKKKVFRNEISLNHFHSHAFIFKSIDDRQVYSKLFAFCSNVPHVTTILCFSSK